MSKENSSTSQSRAGHGKIWYCNGCGFASASRDEVVEHDKRCVYSRMSVVTMPYIISEFSGPFEFLSNFYEAPFTVRGVRFQTVEHWFQAHKATTEDEFRKVLEAETPADARKIGRTLMLRSDWEMVRDQVMLVGVYNKFVQNERLAKLLTATGTTPLIEGNHWHDNYWGRCLCSNCRMTHRASVNQLGKILEEVRGMLRTPFWTGEK